MAPSGLSRIVRDLAPDARPSDVSTSALDSVAFDAVVRIVELQLRQVPLDALTVEVLPAMLAIFDAPAGALLLYRREDATLTLAAARGLAVAGAEALDVLRWGDEQTSEMPLRALVDRKVYVVEKPDEDPFIRRLVGTEQRRPVSTVAAVPLYRWHLPVGVLLILGSTPLGSDALLAPAFAYSVLALALSTLLWAREDRGATPLPASEVAPPPLVCVPWVDRREWSASEPSGSARDAGAREEDRAALDAMLQELRAVVTRMDAERHETTRERAELGERLVSFEHEHQRLAAQLEATERDRNLLASRLASLEETLNANLASMMALSREAPERPPEPAAPLASPPPDVFAAAPTAAPPPSAPVPNESKLVVPPAEHRVLEMDAGLQEQIHSALVVGIPAGRGGIAAVNLVGCDATRVAAMTAAAESGMLIVGYAAHPERGSRILGPLRCFVTPPSAAEIQAAVESAGRGNRRTILLTEDIDGFMGAKAALVKAGHSVSMACDEKQALDLLAILRPDTVLIDVRSVGQPIEFLDALGPETGRVLTMLVHGEPTGAALARVAERMLRPPAIDTTEFVKVCRNALPEAKRPGAAPARR